MPSFNWGICCSNLEILGPADADPRNGLDDSQRCDIYSLKRIVRRAVCTPESCQNHLLLSGTSVERSAT
eukprot:4325591-Pyramimonas_sp.AAC.1